MLYTTNNIFEDNIYSNRDITIGIGMYNKNEEYFFFCVSDDVFASNCLAVILPKDLKKGKEAESITNIPIIPPKKVVGNTAIPLIWL